MTTKACTKCSRVLIVEEHPVAIRGLRGMLASESVFEVVADASSEAEALAAAETHRPDIATVELSLRGGTGLGLIRSFREYHPEMHVLVFTNRDESLYAERAMRAGASGYLSKSAGTDEILCALKTVAAGKIALSESMNAELIRKAIGEGGESEGLQSLSDREMEVFDLIGRGIGLRTIATRLGISAKTVESHRENIKRKLGIETAQRLGRYAVACLENPA